MKRRISRLCIMLIMICMIFTATYHVTDQVQAATVNQEEHISKSSLNLALGRQKKLFVNGTSKKVTWTSSNPKVARVTKKGVVKTRRVGNATITATVGKKAYTCEITVKKPVIVMEEYNNNYYYAMFSDGFAVEAYPGDLGEADYKDFYVWASYEYEVGAVYEMPLKKITLKGYNTKTEEKFKRLSFETYSKNWCDYQKNIFFYLDFDNSVDLYGNYLNMAEGYVVFKNSAKVNALKYDDGTHKVNLYF